ncbi:MAG TPA: beta-galactosidase [Terracidiphilus sp.]
MMQLQPRDLRRVAQLVLLSAGLSILAPMLGATESDAKSVDRLPRVSIDGGYFVANGKRFIPVGAHWVPAKAAMQWPTQWDPAEIEADFAKMHDLGYNMTRIDMVWAWFEPRPGDYNREAFRQLDYIISLGHKYRIYIHPSLFIGGEVGEAWWDVPWRHGRNPQSDPEMLRLETNLAEEFGRRYANETGILAWDLTDEPPFWIVVGSTTDAMAINWMRLITGAIRKHDTMHPILVGTSGEEVGHGPFRPDDIAENVDLFSDHPFTIYNSDLFPDPMVSERGTYGAAFELTLSQGAGHPAMIHEMGGSTAQYAPEKVATYDRLQMYSGLGAGSIGFDLWCYTDASPEQYGRAPYLRTPQETQWGMTTWDRQDKPLATEFRKFSKVLGQMDLAGIRPAPADIAIVIPEEWAKPHGDFSHLGLSGPETVPYVSLMDEDAIPGQPRSSSASENTWLMGSALSTFIVAHRAGMKADFPRELGDWNTRPMLFMPSPLTSTGSRFLVHVHTDFYEKARAYVENGGFLYASVAADAAIPQMETLFGARLVDTVTASEVTLKVVAPFGRLKPGDTFQFRVPAANPRYWGSALEVKGGTVIAVDQDGRPALVAHEAGKGKTLVCAYPIEAYLAATPSVFETPEPTHRIYEAFREWTGVKPVVHTGEPSVEASALVGSDHHYAVLVNHSAKAVKMTVTANGPVHAVKMITPEGPRDIPFSGSAWPMNMDAYGTVVLEWK